jgi:hypothetical protein
LGFWRGGMWWRLVVGRGLLSGRYRLGCLIHRLRIFGGRGGLGRFFCRRLGGRRGWDFIVRLGLRGVVIGGRGGWGDRVLLDLWWGMGSLLGDGWRLVRVAFFIVSWFRDDGLIIIYRKVFYKNNNG